MPGLVTVSRAILAVLVTMAPSAHAAVEVITAENFAEKSHEPVAWLLHLDGGLDGPGPSKLRLLIANCGKYFGTVFPQSRGSVRVGHIDLDSQPQLRQAFCGGAAACPPLVLLPLWSGGRGRLQQQRSKVYTGQPSLAELVQFIQDEMVPASDSGGGGGERGWLSGAATAAEMQAWLQTKPALLEAVRAGKLSAAQIEQVKQMATEELAQQRAAAAAGRSGGGAPAGSTADFAARGGGGGGGRQPGREDAAGGKAGDMGSSAGRGPGAGADGQSQGRSQGRALGAEGGDVGDPFRLDASGGKRPKRRPRGPTGRRGVAAKKRQWWCMWLCRK